MKPSHVGVTIARIQKRWQPVMIFSGEIRVVRDRELGLNVHFHGYETKRDADSAARKMNNPKGTS